MQIGKSCPIQIVGHLADFVLKPGRIVRVNHVNVYGKDKIDIRVWEKVGGQYKYTKRGWQISPDRWIEFVDALNRMEVPGVKKYLDYFREKSDEA